jgi:hypothetical protein
MSYLPRGASTVAAPAPASPDGHGGPGWWAGAPTAVHDPAGGLVVAWRERHGHAGFDVNVIARSADGGATMDEVLRLDARHFGARWIERPALVALPGGGWRLYVCLGYEGTKLWDIHLVESPTLEGLADAPHERTLWFGDEMGVKDPVISPDGSVAIVCGHPLDIPGAEDRMISWSARSTDGRTWTYVRPLLEGTPGTWDARGARFSTWLPDLTAAYDGRASAEENWFERCGIARPNGPRLVATGEPVADIRYLTALEVDGGTRIWWEQRLPDESHELRTELLPD